MRKPNIQDLVYNRSFPNKKQDEPPSLHAHVLRNLVPEVRVEVQTYYGALDCLEAQYPGLDYTYPPHRRRLARYPWHRRLFRVFDELRLTENEILSLCVWEGTRAAKERFERDTNTKIESTTLDDIAIAPRGSGPRAVLYYYDDTYQIDHTSAALVHQSLQLVEDEKAVDETQDAVDLGGQVHSKRAGLQILGDASRSHDNGDAQTFQDRWEQWMKEALERNEINLDSMITSVREAQVMVDSAHTAALGLSRERNEETLTSRTTLDLPPNTVQEGTRTGVSSTATIATLRTILEDLRSARDRLVAEDAALAMFMSGPHPTEAR